MCKAGGGLERDILIAQLTTLVNEWDKIINSSDADESDHVMKHGIMMCRNHVAALIGQQLLEHHHH
ncbi:hypothetical protein FO488_05705 [Geobacter sp. FeAm09]|uniref:hypothetical protein n=1 Tax=Geobacter sp. FeAm09 TaxID=2597769 RepID=UPI0011EBA3EF|nr:hypothetical protein [Geobacter sp. FeAm09]QEM67697.1 hypothetical protein FO488_05705 [Geobacter sp. FeAm09]